MFLGAMEGEKKAVHNLVGDGFIITDRKTDMGAPHRASNEALP